MPEFLQPGTTAPLDIALTDQHGEATSLRHYLGKPIILFIYPKDNTPTCTKEACSLRDGYQDLKAAGYEVLGLSPDGEKSHQKFIAKFDLPFTLLSDPEHELIEALGAWGEKQMYGKKYMGVFRTTFVLDSEGVITHVVEKVKSKEHSEQLLSLLGAAV